MPKSESARSEEIPRDVEAILAELRELGDPRDIDQPNSGLRWQYTVGLVDKADLIELRTFRIRLNYLIEKGLWKP